ncbi:MAG TPA: cytochrome c3 family protein [Gemmatimonadales bacterium]|nr:cytochrome c3 family protein [Gemmatimonadales bacterium]
MTRPPFNPGPDSANGFLGYFTASAKQTNCGNCHSGQQTLWVATKHGGAWADLQSSGHANNTCYACHAVSHLGNSIGKPAGYEVHADSAYQDVQCENCHGPGQGHATSPSNSNQPLASIHVDTGLANGCGGCHTGTHEPFVDQWVQSAHGSGPGFSHAVGNATCEPCHEGKSAIKNKFNVVTNYKEMSDTSHQRIVCAVCHAPHGSSFTHQLRAPIDVPTTDNLCVRCHSRTGTPPWGAASATRGAAGPHGAQGLLVIGQNVGWIPPGFDYDTNQIVSSHGTAANPQLCATCHVVRTTVTDAETGAFKFQSVGHLFIPIPCLDNNGIPTTATNCALNQRDFSGCVSSGCHTSTSTAMSAYTANISILDNLLDQLWVDSNGNGIVDATDGGLLAQMVARGLPSDSAALNFGSTGAGATVTSVAKGTIWNAALAATDDRPYWLSGKVFKAGWAAHASAGNGVHNPFLLQALLTASIQVMHSTYALTLPPNFDPRITATPPPGLRRLSSR